MMAILFRFPMVLDKMAAILLKTEHHWKTKHWNWNSEHVRYSSPYCKRVVHSGIVYEDQT